MWVENQVVTLLLLKTRSKDFPDLLTSCVHQRSLTVLEMCPVADASLSLISMLTLNMDLRLSDQRSWSLSYGAVF